MERFTNAFISVHARGYIAITSSLIEYLLAKLLSFQGFIVLF
ncbi:M13 family peptidase, partial [Lactobacillus delbrueckii subsp. bulgaricus]|nr:M13 family peptidase [Lactobacillus delbrueckii subsp. bulgaricus]